MVLGTRPIETISLSQASSCAVPAASVYLTTTPSPPAFTSVILTPSTTFSPWRVKALCASFAICVSTAPRKVGSASRIVTAAPSRRQTEPISRPITPEPTMPSVFGTWSTASAPSLERIVFSSKAAPGKARGFEPVATMTCLAVSVSGLAPATAISQPPSPFFTNEPRPWKNCDLVLLEEVDDAVVVLLHDRLLARHHLRHVDRQVREADAVVGEVMAGLLEVLRRLQQRLRRNAADVGAGAAGRRTALVVLPLVDAGGGKAELRGADGGDVAAGAGADDDDVEAVRGRHGVRCRTAGGPGPRALPSSPPGRARPRGRR